METTTTNDYQMFIGKDGDDEMVAIQNPRFSAHIVGIPGSGKSHLLDWMAEQAHRGGEGVLILDIKDGELAKQLAARTERPQDVIYVAPGLAPDGMTWSINLLEGDHTMVVDQVMEMFDRNDVFTQVMTQVKQHLRMGIWLALQDENPTLNTVLEILVNPTERRRILNIAISRARGGDNYDSVPPLDPGVIYFWRDFDAQGKLDDKNNRDQRAQTESTAVRLRELLLIGEPLSAMLKTTISSLKLTEWLDEGKLVICDLVSTMEGKGMPSIQSRQMANIIIAQFTNMAVSRHIRPDSRYWRLIVDEFDQLATESFVHTIDKLRSKRIISVLAHQNFEQIQNRRLQASLASQPAKVYFRLPVSDRAVLSARFGVEERDAILSQPRYHARLIQPPDEDDDDDGEYGLLAFMYKYQKAEFEPKPGLTVKTQDWWAPFNQDQLDEIIERSQDYTVPRYGTIEGYDDDQNDLSPGFFDDEGSQTPEPDYPNGGVQPTSKATGAGDSGGEDPAGTRPVSPPQQPAGGRPRLSRHNKRAQKAIQPQWGQGRGRQVTSASVRDGSDTADHGAPAVKPVPVQESGASSNQPADSGRVQDSATNSGGDTRSSLPPALD